MKVLVIGSNGMAGNVITKYLKQQNYEVCTVARSNADFNLDIENCSDVVQFFNKIDTYDYVINCIGLFFSMYAYCIWQFVEFIICKFNIISQIQFF